MPNQRMKVDDALDSIYNALDQSFKSITSSGGTFPAHVDPDYERLSQAVLLLQSLRYAIKDLGYLCPEFVTVTTLGTDDEER